MNFPLSKLCQAVALSRQDGNHSAVALLLKAALIQVSDYRLLGASGFYLQSYVKLSTAVQPSWSEGGTTRHNFRRRTTQESFQQSLVEISPVVSEEVFF
jgi:hypothetical protein